MNSELPYSVVIPAYNAAKTIEKTLDSVFAQTVQPTEVIVVDDGSADSTLDVLKRYGDKIQVISQTNAGPAVARNHGIRVSTTDWIALLDADDSWFPEKMERQLPHCVEDVGIVNCYEFEFAESFEGDEINFDSLWKHNYIGTSTVVLSKKAFEEVEGFSEDRSLICVEDYNLWLRIVKADYRVVTLKEPLMYYTPAEGNLSSKYDRVIQAELLNIDLIAKEYDLPAEMVNQKRSDVLEEYARALFWKRNLPQARQCFGKLLKYRPSFNALGFYLATYLPSALLNTRRTTAT